MQTDYAYMQYKRHNWTFGSRGVIRESVYSKKSGRKQVGRYFLTMRDDKEFYSAHRASLSLRHSVHKAHLPYASRLHKHGIVIRFVANRPRTGASGSPEQRVPTLRQTPYMVGTMNRVCTVYVPCMYRVCTVYVP